MITAATWVRRGYAAAYPTKYVFDEDEYGRIAKLAKLQLDDAEEELEEARKGRAVDNEEENHTKLAGKSSATQLNSAERVLIQNY